MPLRDPVGGRIALLSAGVGSAPWGTRSHGSRSRSGLEEFKRPWHEFIVALEDSPVSSIGVRGTSSPRGRRAARSRVFWLGTIRSFSPFATRTGWRMPDRSDGTWRPHFLMAFSCARNDGSEMSLSRLCVRSFSRSRKARPARWLSADSVKKSESLGSWRVRAPLSVAWMLSAGTLSMPGPPAGPVPARMTLRTRCGSCATMTWAMKPPIDRPNRSTSSNPRARMNSTASRAIDSIVSGVEPLDPPTPRLSKAMIRRRAASPSTTRGSQLSRTPAR